MVTCGINNCFLVLSVRASKSNHSTAKNRRTRKRTIVKTIYPVSATDDLQREEC
jgi:hypothetical protein